MQYRLEQYLQYLKEQEKSKATIEKYALAIKQFFIFLGNQTLQREILIAWKESLKQRYKPTVVNGKLIAVNGFLKFIEKADLQIKLLRLQKQLFCKEEKELSKMEYLKLVQTAKSIGKIRLALMIQTICATGIRVSEISAITKEAVDRGYAEISCKGKNRVIFFPSKLQKQLKHFAKQQKITNGILFRTKTGKVIHRGTIWAQMKRLCQKAHVAAQKVFPHNLRHLFAKTYYQQEKDIAKLADLLGHCSVETTRIYIMESGKEHRKKLEQLHLIL